MRKINEIIVHCTATRPDWWATRTTNQKVAEVKKWHVSPPNNWDDIGYHYLIDRDGTVVAGRPIEKAGAHTQGKNANSIGISLFGGHGSNANDPFEKNFTPEQDEALRSLITGLEAQYPTITKISGHNEYANKACPGFKVKGWLEGKPERTSPAQSTTVQAAAGIALGGGAVVADNLRLITGLNDTSQIILTVVGVLIMLGALWIMRERIRKWAAGVH